MTCRLPWQPYYRNTQHHYHTVLDSGDLPGVPGFWIWLQQEYGAVAVQKQFDPNLEWEFVDETQRTVFAIKWS